MHERSSFVSCVEVDQELTARCIAHVEAESDGPGMDRLNFSQEAPVTVWSRNAVSFNGEVQFIQVVFMG